MLHPHELAAIVEARIEFVASNPSYGDFFESLITARVRPARERSDAGEINAG